MASCAMYALGSSLKREMWYSVQSHLVQLVAFYISQQNEGEVGDEVKSTRECSSSFTIPVSEADGHVALFKEAG